MLRKTTYLIAILIGSVLMMAGLFGLSESKWKRKAGFNRKIRTGALSIVHKADLKYNSYYIAGLSPSRIYLGNSVANAIVTEMDHYFQSVKSHELKVQDRIAWNGLIYSVDSPCVYATERITPAFAITKLADMRPDRVQQVKQSIYQFTHVSNSLMAAVVFDSLKDKNVLATFYEGKRVRMREFPSEYDGGIFATDGIFLHTPSKNRFIYVFYYSNQFIVMDTSLDVSFTGTTIDTTRYPDLLVKSIGGSLRSTLASPARMVNAKAACDDRHLYILSPRVADNERSHKNKTPIDIYELSTGRYVYSFYLPRSSKGIASFSIANNRLYIIDDTQLCWYDLRIQ